MKKLLTVVLFAIIAITQSAWSQISGNAIAFVHVAVIDVLSEQIEPDMTVLLSKNRIGQIGPTKTVRIPKNARTINARGKYLIPGLRDMHVHSLGRWAASFVLSAVSGKWSNGCARDGRADAGR
jgi:cytosine/adenosine deaminase-related metal-dependent hydrolase